MVQSSYEVPNGFESTAYTPSLMLSAKDIREPGNAINIERHMTKTNKGNRIADELHPSHL
jgi:hypothetical protein